MAENNKSSNRSKRPDSDPSHKDSEAMEKGTRSRKKTRPEEDGWFHRISGITSSAFKIARKTTDGSIRVGKTILRNQDQLKVMVAAGQSLRDLREVAGLTIHDLSDAINLKDKTFWEAVENGTATISFELILRLAALLARNDPVPFILKYTRTYNPELWKMLNDWGLGRLPLQYEREREFINIYRRHDAARKLSDEGYQKVLGFTQNAFEMALHFIAETENVEVDEPKEPEDLEAVISKTRDEPEKVAENVENREEKAKNPSTEESAEEEQDNRRQTPRSRSS